MTSDSELDPPQLSPPTLPTLQIWLLGGWRILREGAPLDVPAGQPRSLCAYLLLQPGGQATRSAIIEHLWPDAAPDRARRYLTDALYRLRRVLPPAVVSADAEQVALHLDVTGWVDVWAFDRALASVDPSERSRGLALYTGELLPEFTDAWIASHRMRLHVRFVQSSLAAADAARNAADLDATETLYRRLLQVDPLQEDAQRGLMQIMARRGRLAAALEQYDRFVDLLESELGAPPSATTRDLADQLFQELDLERRRRQRPFPLQMVGRVEERTALRAALDRAGQGERSVAVILGEAGIGKSTLLRDLVYAASWRGWQICWGEADEGVAAAPYAPLTTALAKALPAARARQVAVELPAMWRTLLARLIPELEYVGHAVEQRRTLPAAALHSGQLPQALAQLLDALQTIAPLLILLDDVQWGDAALWDVLDALLPLIQGQRVFLVLSARRDDLHADAAAWAQVTAWDRTGVAQIIALEGLPPADLTELVALYSALKSGEKPAGLHWASGGNPLLALELLAADAPVQPLTTRPAVTPLIQQRLHNLAYPTQQAAEMAAVLGMQVDYQRWEALWRIENPYAGELAPHATELERARVLRIDGNDYTFVHGILHTVALEAMPPAVRRRRHAAALSLLAPVAGAEGDLAAADLLRLLHHAQESGDAVATIRLALVAGQQALQAFSFSGADAHFTLALAHLAAIDATDPATYAQLQAQAITARLGRVEVRHLLADRNGEAADLAALRALSLDDEQIIAVEMHRARYQLITGDLGGAQATITAVLQQAETLASPALADATVLAGKIARERNELAQAYAHIEAAQVLYHRANNPWGAAVAADLLGGVAWDQGDYTQAATLHSQAADVFAGLGDLMREAQALNNLGSTLWELGRYLEARAIHERSVLVCRELGNKLSEGDNIDNLGGVAWVLGDYVLALRHYQAALQLREAIDDQWGVSISLSNLGSVHQMTGNYAEALDCYARSLALSQQVGRKRSEAYIVHCQGQTRLAMGDLKAAWTLLQQALALRSEIGDRLRLLETHALLLQTALARGDLDSARQQRTTILALLQPTDRAGLRHEAYFALFCLAEQQQAPDAPRLLALALHAQHEIADALPSPERARFLQNIPLNQATADAVTRWSQLQLVTLAGRTGPVTFSWTIAHPEDALVEAGAPRRRRVLTRLLREAAAHDAAPTHDQLAAALGVSRRTILRDLPALAD